MNLILRTYWLLQRLLAFLLAVPEELGMRGMTILFGPGRRGSRKARRRTGESVAVEFREGDSEKS